MGPPACGFVYNALQMADTLIVREWDSDAFHRRVLELESEGYTAIQSTYRILAEADPDTGQIIHLHTIELRKDDPS